MNAQETFKLYSRVVQSDLISITSVYFDIMLSKMERTKGVLKLYDPDSPIKPIALIWQCRTRPNHYVVYWNLYSIMIPYPTSDEVMKEIREFWKEAGLVYVQIDFTIPKK